MMGSVCVPPPTPPPSDMDSPGRLHSGGSRSVSDHPLLVMRKRMLSGETKHNPNPSSSSSPAALAAGYATYRRSGSELVREDNLRRIVLSHARASPSSSSPDGGIERCASPSPEQSPPPRSPPPTPGRDHSFRWDADFPTFLPAHHREPYNNTEDGPGILRTPERENDASPAPSTPVPRNLQLRPRFDCEWLKELGLEASPSSSPGKGAPSIPYAPFCEKNKTGGSTVLVAPHAAAATSSSKHHKPNKLLPTGKLAGMNLGQQASAAAAKARPKTFRQRTGVNARCA